MRLLTTMSGESLWRGSIIRLVHNYDVGPGSESVDLMVYDPHESNAGLGVIVVSGYKAGNVLSIFPKKSSGAGKRSLEVSWLLSNWEDWFCYTYHQTDDGKLLPVPLEGTLVIDWSEREIIVRDNAHSRPA